MVNKGKHRVASSLMQECAAELSCERTHTYPLHLRNNDYAVITFRAEYTCCSPPSLSPVVRSICYDNASMQCVPHIFMLKVCGSHKAAYLETRDEDGFGCWHEREFSSSKLQEQGARSDRMATSAQSM